MNNNNDNTRISFTISDKETSKPYSESDCYIENSSFYISESGQLMISYTDCKNKQQFDIFNDDRYMILYHNI